MLCQQQRISVVDYAISKVRSYTSRVEVRFSSSFKRRFKDLSKRYRQIQADIQPVINELQSGNLPGDQIIGISAPTFKARAKNSDIPTGKSGGYRLVYWIFSADSVILITIYAKSDQTDISAKEIEDAIRRALEE